MALNVRSIRVMNADSRQSLGKSGEDLACTELERLGYAIIARRYRSRFGEIDIVARCDQTIVFVEVKARAGDEFGGSAAAVTPWKQRRIAQMALDYLSRNKLHDQPCRFDVVTVDVKGNDAEIVVYRNAFDAPN
jgi:putative endonuclease